MIGQISSVKTTPSNVEIARRKKWQEFMGYIDKCAMSNWMFRGVGDINYDLRPKAGRIKSENYKKETELRIFNNFKRRARLHVNNNGFSDWDWLFLAQHHGMSTRLLDWTSNPLVAAYFAVASGSDYQDAVVYSIRIKAKMIIDQQSEIDPFEVDEVKFVFPSATASRIIAQRGFFTVHPAPIDPWNPPALRKFIIEKAYRKYFRRRLFYLGIDAASLMADLDGICETLTWQYEAGIAVGEVNY